MATCGTLKNINFNNNELYKNLELLKITDIFELEQIKLMHKFYNNKLPTNFQQIFTKSTTKRILRSNQKQTIKTGEHIWILHTGPTQWNDLDESLKLLSYMAFSKALKVKMVSGYGA